MKWLGLLKASITGGLKKYLAKKLVKELVEWLVSFFKKKQREIEQAEAVENYQEAVKEQQQAPQNATEEEKQELIRKRRDAFKNGINK